MTIPPNTSVLEGVLRDGITTNANRVTLLSADWDFVPDATSGMVGSQPPGFTLSPTGVLTFPAVWTNATSTPQQFAVSLTFRVRNDFAQNNLGVSNTARFTSVDQLGQPIDTPDASWLVTLLQPSPSLQKTASPTTVSAGDRVLYTLRSSNASGRPPLHDAWLEDCIPDGLSFDGFSAVYLDTLGPEAGNAANGCDPTQTYVAFGLGTVNGGTSVSRGYYVTVDPPAVGGTSYRNAPPSRAAASRTASPTPTTPTTPWSGPTGRRQASPSWSPAQASRRRSRQPAPPSARPSPTPCGR